MICSPPQNSHGVLRTSGKVKRYMTTVTGVHVFVTDNNVVTIVSSVINYRANTFSIL